MTIPQALPQFAGYPVNFYAERLSDFDVEYMLPVCIKFCLEGQRSELLGAYLGSVQSFEKLRRSEIENGSVILEAQLPVVPAHHWTNPELDASLTKAIGLSMAMSGAVQDMCRHILNCILAEVGIRLGAFTAAS